MWYYSQAVIITVPEWRNLIMDSCFLKNHHPVKKIVTFSWNKIDAPLFFFFTAYFVFNFSRPKSKLTFIHFKSTDTAFSKKKNKKIKILYTKINAFKQAEGDLYLIYAFLHTHFRMWVFFFLRASTCDQEELRLSCEHASGIWVSVFYRSIHNLADRITFWNK